VDFELTEEEDEVMLNKDQWSTQLKLFKTILFYIGVNFKKTELYLREIEERVNMAFEQKIKVNKFAISQIRDSQSATMFEMGEF
jgi:hypothetical protein